jgi:hypothetical protein
VRKTQSDIGTFASSAAEYMTKNDTLLDYYYELSGVGAESDISLTVRECIHQINNARSKLEDVVKNEKELRTQLSLLINRNIEQFSHSGDAPFGYTPLGDELGHTGDTLMTDDIYNGLLEHISWTDHDIQAIIHS